MRWPLTLTVLPAREEASSALTVLLVAGLRVRGVHVASGSERCGCNGLRITAGTREEISVAVAALESVVAQLDQKESR